MNASTLSSRATPSPSLLRRLAQRWPEPTFLLPTYAIQVALALVHHLQIRSYGVGHLRPLIPAAMALVTVWLASGRSEASKYLRSFLEVRRPARYYAFALLYPTAVGLVSLAFLRLIGLNQHVELDFESVGTFEFFELQIRVALSEELAWVSFLTTMLSRRFRPFLASMFVGIAWGVWYVPLVLVAIQIAPGFPILPLILNFMCIAAICAWLYLRTKSAFLVFLMQITTAYTGQIVPVLPARGGETQYVAFVLAKCAFAVALFLLWGPRPLLGFAAAPRESHRDGSST
jgi:membrane protease YdiL (CAAX protease family)